MITNVLPRSLMNHSVKVLGEAFHPEYGKFGKISLWDGTHNPCGKQHRCIAGQGVQGFGPSAAIRVT